VVEDLPRKSEALSSIPIAAKRKKKKTSTFFGGRGNNSNVTNISSVQVENPCHEGMSAPFDEASKKKSEQGASLAGNPH
jgi:hypothetical protein